MLCLQNISQKQKLFPALRNAQENRGVARGGEAHKIKERKTGKGTESIASENPVTHSVMAYVSIPKDLGKVKNKLILNLTRRQIICLSAAAAVGLPFYFITKDYIGSTNAAAGMVLLMLPAFFFAMYEKDGMPLEKILMNVISVKLIRPAIRRYEVENLYDERDDYLFSKPGKENVPFMPGKGGGVSVRKKKK